jgi:hypothetical protein
VRPSCAEQTDRLGPAVRLLADVDISFWWNCCSQIRRQRLELGIGADADVGFAWSGGGDSAGADRAQGATGSSTTDRKICSTDSGGSMSSSLSRFSGWRSRSLSLGEGLTDSTGARDGTRADGVLDRGRRRLVSLAFCLAAPSSYRVDRGRHLAWSTFDGVRQDDRSDSTQDEFGGKNRSAGWQQVVQQ